MIKSKLFGVTFLLKPTFCLVYFDTFLKFYLAVHNKVLLVEPFFFLSLSSVATLLLYCNHQWRCHLVDVEVENVLLNSLLAPAC